MVLHTNVKLFFFNKKKIPTQSKQDIAIKIKCFVPNKAWFANKKNSIKYLVIILVDILDSHYNIRVYKNQYNSKKSSKTAQNSLRSLVRYAKMI